MPNATIPISVVRRSLRTRHRPLLRMWNWLITLIGVGAFGLVLVNVQQDAVDYTTTFLMGYCVLAIACGVGAGTGAHDAKQGLESWLETLPMPRAPRYRVMFEMALPYALLVGAIAALTLYVQAVWLVPLLGAPGDIGGWVPNLDEPGLWRLMVPMSVLCCSLGLALGANRSTDTALVGAIGGTLVLVATSFGLERLLFGVSNGLVGVPLLLLVSVGAYRWGLAAFERRDVRIGPTVDQASSRNTKALLVAVGVWSFGMFMFASLKH